MPTWRGVFAVPVTPFRASLELDEQSLRSEVEFCLMSGVNGIVYPGVASEFFTLSDEERRRATEVVIDAVAGSVPVIIGVSAASTPLAVSFARHAAVSGAAGVMAMPPYIHYLFDPDQSYLFRHYESIATAAELPIVLQNAPVGEVVPMSVLPNLVRRVASIRFVKQETPPATHELSRVIELCGSFIDGVFGGIGGVWMLSELERGGAGTMPAPTYVDRLVAVYRAHELGRDDEARALLSQLGPLFTYELLYSIAFFKFVLQLRGVIHQSTCRVAAPVLDGVDSRAITTLLHDIGIS